MSAEAKSADITVQDTADHSEVRQTNASVYFRRKEQKCTDVACLVVFCVFWAGMLAIMGISIKRNRKPTIVAQFNMDFKTTDEGKAIEGNQKSILFAKVRRDNPEGNTDPTKSTWELEAQRHLMDAKMFNDSVFNAIANKCFFWRDAGADGKKKKAGGYAGMVLSAGAAMVASA